MSRMTKIDETEVRIALDLYHPGKFHLRNVPVPVEVVKVVRRNPLHLPTIYWRSVEHRTGLSPFVLAYLTKYEGGPEALHKWLVSPNNKDFFYNYCGQTGLPVASSRVRLDWRNNITMRTTSDVVSANRPRNHTPQYDFFGRVLQDSAEDYRESAFQRKMELWNISKDSDEAMRTFGGYSIRYETWKALHAMADAYV